MKVVSNNSNLIATIIQTIIMVSMLWSIENQILVWLEDAEIERKEIKARLDNMEIYLISKDKEYIRYND